MYQTGLMTAALALLFLLSYGLALVGEPQSVWMWQMLGVIE